MTRGYPQCFEKIGESGIRRRGYLQIRMGLQSRIGHGKREGHGAKYFDSASEEKGCTEKKCFSRRVSKLVKSAVICTRETGSHFCKSEL